MDVASRSALEWISRLARDLDSRVVHRSRNDLLIHGRSPWPAQLHVARNLALFVGEGPSLFTRAHTLAGRADIAGLVFSRLGWVGRIRLVVEKVLPADYPALSFVLEEVGDDRAIVSITPRVAVPAHEWHPVGVLVGGLLGAVSGCAAKQLDGNQDSVRVALQANGAALNLKHPSQAALDAAFEDLMEDIALYEDELRMGQRLFGDLVGGRVTDDGPAEAGRSVQSSLEASGLGLSAVIVGSGESAIATASEAALGSFIVDYPLRHDGLRVGTVTLPASGVSDFVWACAPAIAADLWRHTRYRGRRLARERQWTAMEDALVRGVAAGQLNKEMACALGFSESHIANSLTKLRAELGGISREELGLVRNVEPSLPEPRGPAISGIMRRFSVPGAARPARDPHTARAATPGMLAQAFALRFDAWENRRAEIGRMRLLADAAAATLDEATGLRRRGPDEELTVDCADEARDATGRPRQRKRLT